PFELPGEDGYGGTGLRDQPVAIQQALGWLEPIAAALAETGARAETVAFPTADRGDDLARLAKLWSATDAVVGDPDDVKTLTRVGLPVTRLVSPLEEAA
ncbi:MAG TPA: hypothetical protein VGJ77_17525, partial [Gaiellaceae bacterium]